MQDTIRQFTGEYNFLSNFYPVKITYDNITYASSEHAYQAQKCKNSDDKLKFIDISAAQAKRLGKKVENRDDWNDVRVQIMYDILKLKFQNSKLRKMLLSTGDKYLMEGNYWNDSFWGYDLKRNKGENVLGNLLCKIRSDIQARLKRVPHPYTQSTMTPDEIKDIFYTVIINGTVYMHGLCVLDFPENSEYSLVCNDDGTVTITHSEHHIERVPDFKYNDEYTHTVSVNVPGNIFYRREIVETYIKADLIRQDRENE